MPTTSPVTPVPGLTSVVVSDGLAVNAIGIGPNGGVITNPLSPEDQGLAIAEPLFIDPVTAAILFGYGTTFRIDPGQSWTVISGQTTPTSVNAASAGHRFSVVSW